MAVDHRVVLLGLLAANLAPFGVGAQDCSRCLYDEINVEHFNPADNSVFISSQPPIHHWAHGGDCAPHLPGYSCQSFELAAADARLLMESFALDRKVAQTLTDRYAGWMRINASRGALQILDCNGVGVVAHIPFREPRSG